MATSTRTNKGTTTTTTTTVQPTGTTTTTATGTVQGQHPALVHMLATLPGTALANPQAAWPGYGKAVRLAGGGSAYVNRGNVDVRATPGQVAQWAKALGLAPRGPQGQYLRLPYSATGTAK